jgi:hypothetical protein
LALRTTLQIAILVTLTGCTHLLSFGDGAFSVNGSLLPTAQNCEVALFTEDGTELSFTRRKIHGEFKADFTVASLAGTYRALVFCEGITRKSMTIRYGSEVKPGQRVSFGEIAH